MGRIGLVRESRPSTVIFGSAFSGCADLDAKQPVKPAMAALPWQLRPQLASYLDRRDKMTGTTERSGGRIVVGVDGTAASLIAVRWAVQEALLRQASVHLVHVSRQYVRAPYSGSPEASRPGEHSAERTSQLAAAELEARRALPPDRVSSELVSGSPGKVLIDRSAGAELLILATAYPAGYSAREEAPPMVGSTTRACLHGAACPVVVVSTSMELAGQRRPDL